MQPGAIAPPNVVLPFRDSRATDVPRDLAPTIGLVCAAAVSALLWAVPIGLWFLLR